MIIPSLTAEFTLTEEDYRELPKLTDDELESLPDLDPNMDGYIKRNSNSNLTGRVSGILGENGVSGEIKKIGFFPPNDPNGQGKEGSCFSWSLATCEPSQPRSGSPPMSVLNLCLQNHQSFENAGP